MRGIFMGINMLFLMQNRLPYACTIKQIIKRKQQYVSKKKLF